MHEDGGLWATEVTPGSLPTVPSVTPEGPDLRHIALIATRAAMTKHPDHYRDPLTDMAPSCRE